MASDVARELPSKEVEIEIEVEVEYCIGADWEGLGSGRRWKGCDYLMVANDAGSEK